MSDFNEIDLPSLSDADLAEFAGELADLLGEMTSDTTVELSAEDKAILADVTAAVDSVDAEIAGRSARADAAAKTARLAEFASSAKAKAAQEAAKKKEEDDESEAEKKAELAAAAKAELAADAAAAEATKAAVAAEAEKPAEKVELAVEIAPAGLKSDEVSTSGVAKSSRIIASSDLEGVRPGTEFTDLDSVAKAFYAKRQNIRGTDAAADGYQYLVASVLGDYDESRVLDNNLETNEAKIKAVTSPEAITASGGICTILEPYYNLQTLGSAERPVKEGLANFRAERGGITFMPSPRLTDLNGSGITITAAQDAAGYGPSGSVPVGGSVFKPSLKVACGAPTSVTVKAITRSLEFGNFGARTYPEQVAAWISLSITHHARRAETELLDQISAASTAVSAARTYGATRTLLPQIDQAAAAYRSRHRMSSNTRFRVMLPEWTKSLLRSDLARELFIPVRDVSDEQVVGWLTTRGVNPSFYLDGPTGGGQVFGAQGAGSLLTYPADVVWYLFVEGSFLFLDGGTLDLGLVRDSTLNSTNDYRIFVETFEAVAFVGVEALKVTSAVIANGAGPGTEAAITVAV